jgi:hypothetical protein
MQHIGARHAEKCELEVWERAHPFVRGPVREAQ